VEVTTTAALFEAYYVQEVLAPSLHSAAGGSWSWTTSRLTREKGSKRPGRAARGCELLYLPYSADLNPTAFVRTIEPACLAAIPEESVLSWPRISSGSMLLTVAV
jgi:hypothetical protein